PAAVGAVALGRRLRAWWTPTRPSPPTGAGAPPDSSARAPARLRALAVGLVVALVVAQTGFVVYTTAYTTPVPRPNFLAQGAQPGDDLDPLVADIASARDAGGVLYYGETLALPAGAAADRPPRENPPWLATWLDRLPMAWYVERAGVEHRQAATVADLPADVPPVVLTTPAEATDLAGELPGYERAEYDRYLFGGTVVAFTDPARTRPPLASDRGRLRRA
ncbi:PurK operon protein / membrane-bound mannosyltransferase, partial [Candidatus Halobonum tyrrellensis G22]